MSDVRRTFLTLCALLPGAGIASSRAEGQQRSASLAASQDAPANLVLTDKSGLVRLPSPKAGTYKCGASQLTANFGANPAGPPGSTELNFGVDNLQSVTGDLILDGRGSYSMSGQSSVRGSYSFDARTNALRFAGPLAALRNRYSIIAGWYSIRLIVPRPSEAADQTISCSLRAPEVVAPVTRTPNPGLTGTLGLHTSDDEIVRFDAASGTHQRIGSGMQPYQARNGDVIFVSNNGISRGPAEFTILDRDGRPSARLELNDGAPAAPIRRTSDIFVVPGGSGQPEFPVLSSDGRSVAYATVDRAGTRGVIVRRRTQNASESVARFADMTDPSWAPDGTLLMAGLSRASGLYRSGPGLSAATPIVTGARSPRAPVISPDGSMLAYRDGNVLWLADASGRSPRPAMQPHRYNLYGFPVFSPDGKWLAVAAAEPNFESFTWIMVVPTRGGEGVAQRLDTPTLTPLIVRRASRITWY
jgi:WD40-like Beta Propeller Repeat